MVRLPIPGGDTGNWGNILNGFILQTHNADGTLKDAGVIAAKYVKPGTGIPKSDLSIGVQTSLDKADSAYSSLSSKTDKSTLTTKGDLYVATAASAVTRIGVGANNQVLTADSAQATGVKWAAPASSLVFNVLDYGADSTGTDDSRTAIQAAITAATAAGGGIVFVPAGTFRVTLADHPDNAAYKVGVIVPSKVHLLGAGQGASTIKLANTQPGQVTTFAAVIMNASLGGGAVDVTISDLTVDGNNVNQTELHHGVAFIRIQRARLDRVTVINVKGTGASGATETFAFEAELSSDIVYNACRALGTAGSTSSGFSANGCTGVLYNTCVASGMSVANGFTHNGCTNITYTGCWSYLNAAGAGFNSEVSDAVTFTGCIAGGKATSASFPFSAAQSLGNSNGFVLNGSTNVALTGCVTESNTGSGVFALSAVTGIITGLIAKSTGFGLNSLDTCYQTLQLRGFTGSGNTANLSNPVAGYHDTGIMAAPAIPATGVAVDNPLEFPVEVYVTGGSVFFIQVNGANTSMTSGTFRIPQGGSITLNYSVAPSWVWISVV